MFFRLPLLLFGIGACLFLASCAGRPAGQAVTPPPAVVWPPPPSDPRIEFVQFMQGPRDLGVKPSFFRSVANWITGDRGESLNLSKPFAVALDEFGALCITDTDQGTVHLVDFQRKRWERFTGAGKVKFVSPVAVARRNGVFFVADSELGKVVAFDGRDKVRFEIGAPLSRPVGLAVTSNELFVVDAQVHALFVFGLDGRYKAQIGRRGTGPGEFNFPTCATVDGRGHLIVTDTMNSRVQIFDLSGKFLSQFGSNGDTSGHFARPKGVAVDTEGHVYVVDGIFDNFQVFNLSGQLLLNVGDPGVGPGGFGLPHGIAISAADKIFVADAFNHRVQIFKYLSQP